MDDKVVISYNELSDSKVDDALKRQADELALRTGMNTQSIPVNDKVSIIYKSWFNLMLAGLVGAFLAWVFLEPFIEDGVQHAKSSFSVASFLFAAVGGFCGLFIGSLEGFLSRNLKRGLIGGLLGMLIGFVGGVISMFLANIVFGIIAGIGYVVATQSSSESTLNLRENISFLMFLIIARCLAWCIAGMTLGLGPGIALRSKRLTLNGFLGGMLGGSIGGILFDPIDYVVSSGSFSQGAELSRCIGLCVIGAMAGLMMGLVELVTMDAWLYMTEGPLKGKQFIIYKNPTNIGSSSSCEIYLFKDPYIDAAHATITKVREGYLLEDNNSSTGTFVNGQRIQKHKVIAGDIIKIGESTLIYREKKKSKGVI